jgi:hypothetical protein
MLERPAFVLFVLVALGASAGVGACANGTEKPGDEASLDAGSGDGFDFGNVGDEFASIAIDPPTAALDVEDGIPTTRTFKVVATKSDGTKIEVASGVGWSATNPQVGAVASGLYTANGQLGGVVQVAATVGGKRSTATLTVRLRIKSDDATTDDAGKDSLRQATAADAAVKWAYPYDDTVWPRGLAGPSLMWVGGAPTDSYRFALSSPTFEFEGFAKVAPPAKFPVPAKTWERFVESTTGAARLKVTRLAGATATVIADLKWTVAPGSMRGTIYYWSNREGRVLRIKPGAAAPDDFSAGVLPATEVLDDDGKPFTANCTMSCHKVSADGSTLISGGDTFGGSYDLVTNAPRYTIASKKVGERRSWHFAGPTPDGKHVVLHGAGGLHDTKTAATVPDTGLEGVPTLWPNFDPTGKSLVYVTPTGPSGTPPLNLFARDFDAATAKFSNPRQIVDSKAVPTLSSLSFSSASPDGQWVIYQRASVNSDTRGTCIVGQPSCAYDNRSALYLAPIAAQGVETELTKLNGTNYPFAAGTRDQGLNFEPTFAPVAAGGYFWVVFTSRRTYGNELQGPATTLAEAKQLWVAAIDSTITPGKDPSHAAFHLPGQALAYGSPPTNSLNMSGYWALSPCQSDGATCEAGSDCCGGFCEKKEGASTGTCKSSGGTCSAEGDRCTTTDDCCGKAEGDRCIGGYCSQRPPS